MAQCLKKCELCESAETEFKCIECRKFICPKCRMIHAKILSNHQIVQIRATTNIHQIQPQIRVDFMPCNIHSGKIHCLFCKSCRVLVCPDCIASSHFKHNFVPLMEACEDKLAEFRTVDSKIESELVVLQQSREKLQRAKSQWQSIVSETEKLVDKNELEIKEAISDYAKKLRSTIEKKKQNRIDAIDETDECISTKISKLCSHRQNIQTVLSSDDGLDIFKPTVSEIDHINQAIADPIKELPIDTIDLSTPRVDQKDLKKMFGRLSYVSLSPDINLEYISKIQTSISCVDKLIVLTDDYCWMSVFDYRQGMSYVLNAKMGKSINKMHKLNVDAFDLAVTMSGDLLISVHMTPEVKRVPKNGSIESFIDVSPLLARGICVTPENDILVGVREDGDPYDVTDKSCRKIIVFDCLGVEKSAYEYDQNNQRLFTIPRRIITSSNGDIVVSDSTSKDSGRVMALGTTGNIKWIYDGSPCEFVSFNSSFDPDDLTSTSLGYIVVSDERNHCLFVLSVLGDPIAVNDLKEWGIYFPRSLSASVNGHVWIGCATQSIQKPGDSKTKPKENASIHCIKLVC